MNAINEQEVARAKKKEGGEFDNKPSVRIRQYALCAKAKGEMDTTQVSTYIVFS